MGIAPLAKQGKEFMMVYNLIDRMTMNLVVRNDALEKAGYDPNTPRHRARQDAQRSDHRHHAAGGADRHLLALLHDWRPGSTRKKTRRWCRLAAAAR